MWRIKEALSNALTRFIAHDRTGAVDWLRVAEAGPMWGLLAGEVHEAADHISVRLEVPGMETSDFNVHVLGLKLVVRGEKRSEQRTDSGHFRMSERAYGSFERVIDLPAEVLPDKVKAKYRRGVLHIELPKAQRSEPRRIKVKVHDALG